MFCELKNTLSPAATPNDASSHASGHRFRINDIFIGFKTLLNGIAFIPWNFLLQLTGFRSFENFSCGSVQKVEELFAVGCNRIVFGDWICYFSLMTSNFATVNIYPYHLILFSAIGITPCYLSKREMCFYRLLNIGFNPINRSKMKLFLLCKPLLQECKNLI